MSINTPSAKPLQERVEEASRYTTKERYLATRGINTATVEAIHNLINSLKFDRDVALELIRQQLELLGNNPYFLDNLYSAFEAHPEAFNTVAESTDDSEL